jgi:hypothetical protein
MVVSDADFKGYIPVFQSDTMKSYAIEQLENIIWHLEACKQVQAI